MDRIIGDQIVDEEQFELLLNIAKNEFKDGAVPAIRQWYENDELGIIIVEGRQGWGKSVYALLVLANIYNTWNWSELKKYIVYKPDEIKSRFKKKRKREPLLVWDDAGNWLNSKDYQKKAVKGACRYFQVARSHWGCIMLTTVDSSNIVTDIRNMKGRYLIQVWKSEDATHLTRRIGRVYLKWKSPDKTRSGEEEIHRETFYLKDMPKDLYSKYKMYRDSFSNSTLNDLNDEDDV